MMPVSESANFRNLTATTTVYTGQGALLGFFVATGTGTIAISDGATPIIAAFSPTAGGFFAAPARFSTSLVVTIVAPLNCTIFWS